MLLYARLVWSSSKKQWACFNTSFVKPAINEEMIILIIYLYFFSPSVLLLLFLDFCKLGHNVHCNSLKQHWLCPSLSAQNREDFNENSKDSWFFLFHELCVWGWGGREEDWTCFSFLIFSTILIHVSENLALNTAFWF